MTPQMTDVMQVINRYAPKGFMPKAGIILGSGLSSLAEQITNPVSIPYQAIPGLQGGGVAGHASLLVMGYLQGMPIVCLRGRLHLYEGVSYEAIRCDTTEQKAYAFGRRDGTWSNARAPVWRKIRYQDVNRQHGVLYAHYFCPDGAPIASVKDAINRFKYGVPYGQPPRSSNRR